MVSFWLRLGEMGIKLASSFKVEVGNLESPLERSIHFEARCLYSIYMWYFFRTQFWLVHRSLDVALFLLTHLFSVSQGKAPDFDPKVRSHYLIWFDMWIIWWQRVCAVFRSFAQTALQDHRDHLDSQESQEIKDNRDLLGKVGKMDTKWVKVINMS